MKERDPTVVHGSSGVLLIGERCQRLSYFAPRGMNLLTFRNVILERVHKPLQFSAIIGSELDGNASLAFRMRVCVWKRNAELCGSKPQR